MFHKLFLDFLFETCGKFFLNMKIYTAAIKAKLRIIYVQQ